MQSPSLVLVFAQSGRFIAESATRAGYTVRVADCFGDTDMLAVAEQWQQLPPLNELSIDGLLKYLTNLSNNMPCWLVCGSGIEKFYPVLDRLPSHIQVAGNHPHTIAQLRQPATFFNLLEKLELPFPTVSTDSTCLAPWLIKDLASCGGSGIVRDDITNLSQTQYYQRFIEADSHSVCFIADGKNAHILGWNHQWHDAENFRLNQLSCPDTPSDRVTNMITEAVNKLVTATGLCGLNSLDYLIDKHGQPLILEVNPRISASVELVEHDALFKAHLESCRGKIPTLNIQSSSVRVLKYLFAKDPLNIINDPVWPAGSHDHPSAGSTINIGMPIATLITHGDTEAVCQQQLETLEHEVRKNCYSRA